MGVISIVALTATSAEAQRCRGCAPEDTANHFSLYPGFGLRIGEPQQASLAAGIIVGRQWQRRGHEHSRDVALFVEPGLGAGRASFAYIEYGHGNFGSGAAIALTALRTWRDPWGVQPNVSYVGGELFVWPVVFVGPRIGVFHSVTMGAAANRWLFSIDLGLGL
jgi:hypothetical protein